MECENRSTKVFLDVCRFGRGVFASASIEPGEEILRFVGPRIDLAQALAKGDLHCNTLQIDHGWYLDLDEPGILVNHACDPNSGVVNDVVLVALRPIARGEEILWDYSTTMDDGTWEMNCRCGSPHCRGVVLDFEFLPPAVQQRYLALGIVQRFIARQYASVRIDPAAPLGRVVSPTLQRGTMPIESNSANSR